eukprot:6473685-Amphidinium_carterae.2
MDVQWQDGLDQCSGGRNDSCMNGDCDLIDSCLNGESGEWGRKGIYVEIDFASKQHVTYAGAQEAQLHRTARAKEGFHLTVQRAHWQAMMQHVRHVAWEEVPSEGNLCFWHCLSFMLKGLHEDAQLLPHELKDKVITFGHLHAAELARDVGGTVENLRKDLQLSQTKGALANEKCVQAAAHMYGLNVVVMDWGQKLAWTYLRSLGDVSCEPVAYLWLARQHFWVAQQAFPLGNIPLCTPEVTILDQPRYEGGGKGLKVLAAVTAAFAKWSALPGDWAKATWLEDNRAQSKVWNIATHNANVWKAQLAQLQLWSDEQALPDVILNQEHHLLEQGLESAAGQAFSMGYKSYWTSAVSTGKGTSGGTAILVAKHIGAKQVQVPDLLEGKVTAVRLEGISAAKPLLVSVYLDVNATQEKLISLLCILGEWLDEQQPPFILGGDWNQHPHRLQHLGWPQFHALLDSKVLGVEVEDYAVSRPHNPVRLMLRGRGPRVREPKTEWTAFQANEGDQLEQQWIEWSSNAVTCLHAQYPELTGPMKRESINRGNGQKLVVSGIRDVACKEWQRSWSLKTLAWWCLASRVRLMQLPLEPRDELWFHEKIGTFSVGWDTWTVPALNAAYRTTQVHWQEWVTHIVETEWLKAVRQDGRRRHRKWREFCAEALSQNAKDGYRFLRNKGTQWVEPINEIGQPLSGQRGADKLAAQWFNLWAEHPKEERIGAIVGLPPITAQD